MNMKEMIATIVMVMLVLTMFASTAMAAITVDGQAAPANEWAGDWLKNDPCTTEDHGMGLWGYNLEALYQHYDVSTDTLFFRLDVCGIPADLDGDGDTGTDGSPIPPGDWAGVGTYEQYTIILSDNTYTTGKPGANLYYNANTVLHPKGFAAWGTDCVEFSLDDASDYVDPMDYCIHVSAGGSSDTPYSEDLMYICYCDDPPEARFDFNQISCGSGTLDASASTDDVGIVEYAWDFCEDGTGDYDDAYGVSVSYSYIGTCNVGLKVTDKMGQTDTVHHSVTLTGDPTADASATTPQNLPAGGGTVLFDGSLSSPYAGTTIVSYTWDIPGKGTFTGVTKSVFIDDTVTATLTVKDNHDCEDTDTVTIHVQPPYEPPSDVPILTPTGMVALIGMLCIVGAGRILTKGRRL